MKISMARMITNLVAKGRALGNRFAWVEPLVPRPERLSRSIPGRGRAVSRSLEGVPAHGLTARRDTAG
jgi:hypothetical protein